MKRLPIVFLKMKTEASSGALYGLGVIGAAVYFIQQATSFGAGIIGIGKAIFWPAVVLYKLLGLLQL